jgi:O-antigen/teichoic acid export membrane protein
MKHEIKSLDRKGLREFGIVTGAIVAVLFGLFFPWLLATRIPLWPWILAGVLVTWALLAPGSLEPVYRGWMRFGLLIGSITTPLILGIVFFLLIMPMGLVMRTFRYDPLSRALDKEAASYRVPSRKPDAKSIERPF